MLRTYLAATILSLLWLLIFWMIPNLSAFDGWWSNYILREDGPVLCLMTTHFFHANAFHLFGNITLVFSIAFVIQHRLDAMTSIAIWLLSAPIATAATFYVEPGAIVGASGGILGILGSGLSRSDLQHFSMNKRAMVALLVMACALSLPGDSLAHVVGLLSGYAIGITVNKPRALLLFAFFSTLIAIIFLHHFN